MEALDGLLDLVQTSRSAALVLVFLSVALVALTIVLFVAAFRQGRSITFWPPKIGPRPRPGPGETLSPSPLTPESPILKALIESSLETVCRAVSLPETPQSSRLRVFIFRKEEDWLVCRYHWSQDPVRERVGKLRFQITAENAERVAVVRALRDERICRTAVNPLPSTSSGRRGDVDDELAFVLAAPILNADGTPWGTVDFDAATEQGRALLSTRVSDAVMHQLARHLQVIFSFQNEELAVA